MKRKVQYFVSYAHDDTKLAGKLLAELKKQFGASKGYEFVPWRDTDILPGETWHMEIQNAIATCDFGLLLVSPAFLSSSYVDQHEIPQFLSGGKTCIPVALCRIDFDDHDLKGLEELDLFRYQSEGSSEPRAFEDYTSQRLQSNFALELFRKIKRRLDKKYASAEGATILGARQSSTPGDFPRSDSRTPLSMSCLATVILPLVLVIAAIVAYDFINKERPSAYMNLGGSLGRVEPTERCPYVVGWVSLRADDSIRIGLSRTTLLSNPQLAVVRVQRRLKARGGYEELPEVKINVGSSGILGKATGTTYTMTVSNIEECLISYSVSVTPDK